MANPSFRFPIRSRLQWSMAAMVAAMTLISGACLLLLVFWFESTLFYNHLASDLETEIQAYRSQAGPLKLSQHDTTFYKLPALDHPLLPPLFHGYGEGNYEIVAGDKAYNLFIRQRPPWVYVLVQDQSEFERHEILAVAGVILGGLLITLFGVLLSRHFAARILRPVQALAAAVEGSSRAEPGRAIDPSQFPADEIGRLAQALQNYDRRIIELLERERRFTADVSHELRGPLMVIQAANELLKELPDRTPAQQRQIERIERGVQDMRTQLTLYLQLAREPEQLQQEVSQSLAEAAASAQAQWQARAEAKGLSLACTVPEAATAAVPAPLIQAVLNNLLQNALNHTEQGGISLEVNSRSVTVRDSGSGIDPALRGRIFEHGVHSSQGSADSYGIGLSIVKRICDHQGWQLSVAANTPQGAVFTLRIPPPAPAARL